MRSLLLLALVAGAASCVTPASSFDPKTLVERSDTATPDRCVEECAKKPRHFVVDAPAPPPTTERIAWQVPLEVTQEVPALAGSVGTVPAFQFVCGAAALRISPPTGSADYLAMTVWNGTNAGGPNANAVFLGDTTGMTNTAGMPICATSSCVGIAMEYEARNVFCLAPGGATTITVQIAKPRFGRRRRRRRLVRRRA